MLPWYKDGLRFECTGCGKCCTGAPGYIFVTIEEIEAIAKHIQMDLTQFCSIYIRKVGERYSINEDSLDFSCLFLKDNKCTIYPVRPTQCRTYPFWLQNLKSKESWEEASLSCEGISPTAPLIPLDDILARQKG